MYHKQKFHSGFIVFILKFLLNKKETHPVKKNV